MGTQDFRSLQEAYMEVVMNEGKKSFPFDKVSNKIKSKREKQQELEKDVESGFISKKEQSHYHLNLLINELKWE
jgi:hypothetical protein